MLNLIATSALSASKLYKRIMRHYCYTQIHEKKKQKVAMIKFKETADEDLFIDFKLDLFSQRPNFTEIKLFELMF